MEDFTSPLVLGFVGGFFLVAILTLTAFIKLSVVMMVVRQAMGLQQVPSNVVVMALALFLAIFISMPVFSEAVSALSEANIDVNAPTDLYELWRIGIAPFQTFMARNIDPAQSIMFVDLARETWAGSGLVPAATDFVIQVPAFMVTELTQAFMIGFLLYLPFVAIDLAITGILMAMGMQQVQPNIIAVPFKLLIFVFVDGWGKLVSGLVLTYGG